jgi:DNA-directed RNA polymerase subunit L
MSSDIIFSDYREEGPTLLSSKDHQLQAAFRVAPIHVTTANTIRRQILAAIPTVGFKTEPPEHSDVHIEVNTTPLVNEMLAHRIGMIPVSIQDPESFNPAEYEFRMNLENVGSTPVSVSASNFNVFKLNLVDGTETQMPTDQFFPVDPITNKTSLITVLRPRYNMDSPAERLVIRAKASVGTGRQNMRYSCVSQCSYEYTPDPDPSRQAANLKEWLAISKKVADSSAIPPERLAELTREFNCMEVERCYLQNTKGEPYDFTFHLESAGILSIPTIIERGIKSCIDIVSPYVTLDVDIPTNEKGEPVVSIQRPARRMEGVFELTFQNEEHTLGNLLQTFLVERFVEGEELPKVAFAGYKVPHPLRAEMVLIVSTVDGQEATVRTAVAKVCQYLQKYFNEMLTTWQSTPKDGAVRAPVMKQAPAVVAAAPGPAPVAAAVAAVKKGRTAAPKKK